MSESMHQSHSSSRAALAQRSAQLEQHLNQLLAGAKRIPLRTWQWIITFFLVLWLSHTLAQLFWLLMPSPQIPPASIALVATGGAGSTGQAAESSININQLKTLTPFGNAPVAAPEPEQPQAAATTGIEDDAADTQLNLVLRGVLASNHEQAARAVISSGDRQEVYAIGDKLPVGNNVTLAKVLDLRVIISNNGKYESLWLFKDDPNAPKIASPMARPPAGNPQRDSGYAQAPFQQRPVHVDPQPEQRQFGPDPAGDPRMAAMGNTLADVVAMSIHREGGQVVGYKIRPGRNAEMFNSLGLQTDDIVTAVNGVPLTSPGKIMEIYKNMSNATSANLEIKRGGSVINLDIVLN
ncbi:type II secretion system protein GspC [Cellvibrio japonicus]|nr:type II secretion system protein GspC [Cellvibrio japonicus]